MNICITSQGKGLESAIDPRFGRCSYFLFVDQDVHQVEAVENPNKDTSGGAGIQSAQLVAGRGIKVVLTGNIGPNAFKVLEAAGISVFTGEAKTVKEMLEAWKSGSLKSVSAPTVERKH